MATKPIKYYTVWKGHQPGVYHSWMECKAQIDGFTGAQYKSFDTLEAAQSALKDSPYRHFKKESISSSSAGPNLGTPSISVDAACSGNPGMMEYQGVDTATKRRLFHAGPFPDATNNIGEFLALVHGLAYLYKHAYFETPIYTDSITALAWVRKKQCMSKLEATPRNQAVFELITRAEQWLKTHTWKNPIIKWDTERWGEIPADFGRK